MTLLPTALERRAPAERARAQKDLGRFDPRARGARGKDASPDARDLQGEIAWKQQDSAIGRSQANEGGLGDRWKFEPAAQRAPTMRAG